MQPHSILQNLRPQNRIAYVKKQRCVRQIQSCTKNECLMHFSNGWQGKAVFTG